jgi:hypothetical protein
MKRKSSYGRPLDWRDTLQIGDIVKTKTGYRVVRDVKYWPENDHLGRGGMLNYVAFAIQRKSWTTRAYTLYCRTAITAWEKVEGVRAKLDTDADKKLLEDIREFRATKNPRPTQERNPFLRRIRIATDGVDNYDYRDAKSFP